jgi:gliding motility-associated-like protein
VTINTADFKITKAALTVTASSDQTKVYGADEPTLTYSITGFVNGDTEASLDTRVSVSRAAGEVVGDYTITTSGAADSNYTIGFVTADFEIIKATLTVTADDQTKRVGVENPKLTITYDGFVNGETVAVLGEVPVSSTMANKDSSVGTYVIELTSVTDANYEIEIIEGILSITSDLDGNVLSIQKSYGISPNGDGVNATWNINDIEKYPNNRVQIFNRSGKMVYEKRGYNNTFDGFSNKISSRRKLPVGPYYFVLELNVAGAPPIKGWLYINY